MKSMAEALDRQPRSALRADTEHRVCRTLGLAAAGLALSVFADSTAEHYKARFHNRVMFAGPAVSGLTLAAAATTATRTGEGLGIARGVFAGAILTGIIGATFHIRNVSRRRDATSWESVMHGPPLGAPLGLSFAGVFGLAALRAGSGSYPDTPHFWNTRTRFARVVGSAAAIGLLGTAAEAGVLHLRGAFHNPLMFAPVTLPPAAALALTVSLVRSENSASGSVAHRLLQATAVLGLAGAAAHSYGVSRRMGGWRNWRQNVLAGPPIPAPPAFTGMALAGLAALSLLRRRG